MQGRDERIRLQSKSEMRGSPDEADALAMTFAAPPEGGVQDMGVRGESDLKRS